MATSREPGIGRSPDQEVGAAEEVIQVGVEWFRLNRASFLADLEIIDIFAGAMAVLEAREVVRELERASRGVRPPEEARRTPRTVKLMSFIYQEIVPTLPSRLLQGMWDGIGLAAQSGRLLTRDARKLYELLKKELGDVHDAPMRDLFAATENACRTVHLASNKTTIRAILNSKGIFPTNGLYPIPLSLLVLAMGLAKRPGRRAKRSTGDANKRQQRK